MAQEQVQKQKSQTRTEDTHVEVSNTDVSNQKDLDDSTSAVLEDIDDVLEDQVDEELLGDIDDVLEENAEEFVSQYVQQGGE